ncbi:MAG: LuxR family transcriptional regulator [Thermomonas sp.]
MKTLLAALLALSSMPASAQSPIASPILGHWSLQVDKLATPPETHPKRVDLEFRDAGDGRIATHVVIVDPNDHTLDSQSELALDGTPGKATGTYWVDLAAAKMPAPNVLVMQFAYQGQPTSTRVYSVDAHGVLTETEAYFKPDGTPVMRTAVFTRVASNP